MILAKKNQFFRKKNKTNIGSEHFHCIDNDFFGGNLRCFSYFIFGY